MAAELKKLNATNANDLGWSATRFENSKLKNLFYRDGLLVNVQKFEPGAHAFRHQHGFRQVRYVLEGELVVNGTNYGPGSLIEFPEFTDYEADCPRGGTWLVVQVPGKTGVIPPDPQGPTYGTLNQKE